MGEGKGVLDVAIVYINRHAFGITAKLEGFLLFVHQRWRCTFFVLQATWQEMKR